jgi:hypothetical protein
VSRVSFHSASGSGGQASVFGEFIGFIELQAF